MTPTITGGDLPGTIGVDASSQRDLLFLVRACDVGLPSLRQVRPQVPLAVEAGIVRRRQARIVVGPVGPLSGAGECRRADKRDRAGKSKSSSKGHGGTWQVGDRTAPREMPA